MLAGANLDEQALLRGVESANAGEFVDRTSDSITIKTANGDEIVYDLIYTNEFSFARFLQEHPQHQGNLTDLLIGRAFYPGAGRIFDDLEPALEAARSAAVS